MRKIATLLIALLLTVCLPACSSKPRECKSASGGFAVMTLAQLTETTQPLETQAGKVDLHLFSGQDGNTGYFVSYCDYPPDFAPPEKAEQMLDGARDGAVHNAKGKLIQETKITLMGHPGREVVIAARGEDGRAATIKGRLYMVKNRLYQVVAVAPSYQSNVEELDHFLQSFKLLGQ